MLCNRNEEKIFANNLIPSCSDEKVKKENIISLQNKEQEQVFFIPLIVMFNCVFFKFFMLSFIVMRSLEPKRQEGIGKRGEMKGEN